MFKFIAFALWVYLVCLFPLHAPSYYAMTNVEKICFNFKSTILMIIWYAVNLIYVISYWTHFSDASQNVSMFVMSMFITLYVIFIGIVGMSEDCYESGFRLPQMKKDFFRYSCNKKMEKFSYKFVKQFYTLHPKNFRLMGDKFFVCGFTYYNKDSSSREEIPFCMNVIDYIRFIFFVKHHQKKEELESNENKKLRDVMISLLEEDRKQIAEDEALAREEFLAARKDNGVIAARLEKG